MKGNTMTTYPKWLVEIVPGAPAALTALQGERERTLELSQLEREANARVGEVSYWGGLGYEDRHLVKKDTATTAEYDDALSAQRAARAAAAAHGRTLKSLTERLDGVMDTAKRSDPSLRAAAARRALDYQRAAHDAADALVAALQARDEARGFAVGGSRYATGHGVRTSTDPILADFERKHAPELHALSNPEGK
jgi:hypothetical protein